MNPSTDLTGKVFGWLSPIKFLEKTYSDIWLCTCSGTNKFCKGITKVSAKNLISGNVLSCGCMHLLSVTRHGNYNHFLFHTWKGMHDRCYNKNHRDYHRYGKRGIKVCERWHKNNPEGFKNFLKDVGTKPNPDYSIDRYPDNNGDYSPDNFRWATKSQQRLNCSNTVNLIYNNNTYTVEKLSKILNIPKHIVAEYWRKGKNVKYMIENYKPAEKKTLKTLEKSKLIELSKNKLKSYNGHVKILEHEGIKFSVADWGDLLNLTKVSLWKKMKTKDFKEIVTKYLKLV